MVARAIDGFIGNEQGRQDTLNRLIKFLDTDSICYQQDFPVSIVKAQEKHWTPILNWVKEEYDLDIKVSQGITYVQQDEATKNKLREIVESMSDIELSGNSVCFLYVSVDVILYFENTRLTFLPTFGKKKKNSIRKSHIDSEVLPDRLGRGEAPLERGEGMDRSITRGSGPDRSLGRGRGQPRCRP